MRNAEYAKCNLNPSQTGIWQNELVAGKSAINVITIKLHIDGFAAETVRQACDRVLEAADIFRMELEKNGSSAALRVTDAVRSHAVITDKMTKEQEEAYTESLDTTPFEEGMLYSAEVIPLQEGGVLLYVRFHHLIIDGYGMSLFAQYVLDALEGREGAVCADMNPECGKAGAETDSISAGTDSKDAEDEQFWRSYFAEADFQPAIFAEEPEGLCKQKWDYEPEERLAERAAQYAGEIGVSVPYVYLAAYAVYLARATGKRDAVILMPRLGRNASQLYALGCFTLLVPVRINIEETDSFSAVCIKAKKAAQTASAHKGYGFEKIRRLCVEENPEVTALSEYVFNYYKYEINSTISHTLSVSVAGAMHNHLTWNVFSFDGKTHFSFDMRKGVYGQRRIGYFTDSIEAILSQGMEGRTVQETDIIGANEREAIFAVKGKEIGLDSKASIVSIFRRAVKEYGSRPALYAGENSLTFTELDELSDRIAGGLLDAGVKKGDAVAFLLYRDIRLIPTIFGILKAGAAFVPIDPKYPKERIETIVTDSEAKHLISVPEAEGRTEQYLNIDSLINSRAVQELPEVTGEDLAYLIYTSGTTGKPKGVMLAHRGIVNIVEPDNNPFNSEITGYGRDRAEKGDSAAAANTACRGLVAVGSISFDISLYEIFVPLMNGMFIELAPEEALTDPKRLAELIAAHGADTMHCTPSRLASYLKLPVFAESFRNVKAVLSAGEVLHGSFVDELKSRCGVKIFNGYGPTETTIGATITEAGDNRTIGKPIGNTGILILGKANMFMPYGAVGEICIYGTGMGLGYKNLPEKTREKFCRLDGLDIYRTGDLGHLDEDGSLIYHGRNDRLVKLRGLRIELPEIEGSMAACAGVSAAVCLVRKLGQSEHLVGFYTVQEGAGVEEKAMKAQLGVRLPAYMVPDVLVRLEEMPQTTSGKTDMKALAAYPVEAVHTYVAPRNKAEAYICEKMAALLECESVSVTDSFFDLGGNSLTAVMLLIELESYFGEGKLDVTGIYQCPTPMLLAECLVKGRKQTEENPLEDLEYEKIDAFLAEQDNAACKTGSLGTVLVTGVTGYLGVHILLELLSGQIPCEKIYCLARGKGKLTARDRVKNALFYYGENDFAESYGTKWEVIEGDITNEAIVNEALLEKIDTVINSAANVAHFSHDDTLKTTNTDGVRNLIAFCKKQGATLCQVSTISVGGVFPAERGEMKLSEQELFIGQKIHNQYILSKYMAEYEMLKAASEGDLKVKIMRVGNLQGRIRDGEFQMNMKTNAFTRQISSYVRMGAVPQSLYEAAVNFSPIDEVAHMIVALSAAETGQKIFHVYPPTEVPYKHIFEVLNSIGCPVSAETDEEFEAHVQTLKQTEEGRGIVEGILIERPDLKYRVTETSNERTEKLLEQCGESWASVTEEYLTNYLSILRDMGMFEGEEL